VERAAGSRITSSRTLAGLGAVLVALAAAGPAGAAEDTTGSAGGSSAATGGSRYFAPPQIASLQCATGCGGSATASRSRVLAVREKGVLRIRGRNLDEVRNVLFLGAPGRGDNLGVAPERATARSLDVKVPVGAGSGRVVLIDPRGHSSPPSRTALRVLVDPGAPSSQGIIWPVRGTLTGWFGEQRPGHVHTGLDIATAAGTPIRAAAAGTVILLGAQGGYGNFTCIRHTALVTCYAHQSQYLTTYGAHVQQGQVIGRIGCTGNCSGPHLHFEVRRGPAAWSTPMDPLKFLPRR
jgi:murein DD-endopeptidase MepM/ murein hydrolase activator NlpD